MQGQYPYYGPTQIQDFINEYRFCGDYALIGEDGDHFLKWRTRSMTLLATGRFNVNNHAHVLRGGRSHIGWFYHYFCHRDVTSFLTRQGASRFKLTKAALEGIPCAIPPIAEQEAIAEALSDADALIEALEQLIDKKRRIKQGMMQALLTGRRRLLGFEGDWERRRLGDATRLVAGGTPSTSIASYWGGLVPWMSSGELHAKRVHTVRGRITKAGLENSAASIVPTNSVLVGLAGQGKTRGTVAIGKIPLATNQSIAAILPCDQLTPEYLYQNLNWRYSELRELSAGDGGRGGLNLTILGNLIVPTPTVSEQKAIAQVLSDHDAEIEALQARLKKTRQLKQGMAQQLLTGRIRLV